MKRKKNNCKKQVFCVIKFVDSSSPRLGHSRVTALVTSLPLTKRKPGKRSFGTHAPNPAYRLSCYLLD